MTAISNEKGLLIPLDDLEEEEARKFTSVKNWATELEKASSFKSRLGKQVSFNLDPNLHSKDSCQENKKRRPGGSPKHEDKTTRNNEPPAIRPKDRSEAGVASQAILGLEAPVNADRPVMARAAAKLSLPGFD